MLESLRLQNFRCFDALSLDLDPSGTLIIGDNAQGKTSILEAICVLLRLGSPRSKRMQPMVKFEAEDFGIAGEFSEDSSEYSLQVRFGKSTRGKALALVDREELSTQSQYLQSSGLVVWMGNEDVELIRGSGGVRRHYLDFLCSQIDPAYRIALSRYKKVLKARNLLLKDGAKRDQEINAYGELLIEYGDLLSSVRQKTIHDLLPKAATAQVAISEKAETLGLEYISGSGNDMRTALQTTYESERRQRQTIAGPHRDEMKITINNMSAADYASEGQQRTIALALKLAQGDALRQYGRKMPIFLLDDIFGELDAKRRNALMASLPANAQKIITTTNVDWLQDQLSNAQQIKVTDGTISATKI